MEDIKELLYKSRKNLEREFLNLDKSPIIDCNKEKIKQYIKERIANGRSVYSSFIQLVEIRNLALKIEKDFFSLTKEDIVSLLCEMETNGNLSIITKNNKKSVLKTFLKHIGREDIVNVIHLMGKTRIQSSRVKNPSDLLTYKEHSDMILAAKNLRDKFAISLAYEIGCRPGELLGLRIRDIDIQGKRVLVNLVISKTDIRTIPIVNSVPYFIDWLKIHPYKDDKNAFIFVPIRGKNINCPISTQSMNQEIKRAAERAGIEKDVYTNLLRHCSCTNSYDVLPLQTIEYRHGWRPGTRMIYNYTHLKPEKHIRTIEEKLYGINVDENIKILKNTKTCLSNSCRYENAETHQYCAKCNMPLDSEEYKKVIEANEIKNKLDKILFTLIESKEFKKRIGSPDSSLSQTLDNILGKMDLVKTEK